MPHGHVEVYPSLDNAASGANRFKTSQFTFPMATLNEAYAASVRKLAQISYATQGHVVTLIIAVNG